jgi:hypothetical protein
VKSTIFSLLVVGLFAGFGTSAIAKGTAAGTQAAADADSTTQMPAKSAKQTNPATPDVALESTSRSDYKTAAAKAQTDYEEAKAKSEPLQGNPMRSCMTDANTARTEALVLPKTQWETRAR